MPPVPLVHRELLDPRPSRAAATRPITHAVNIPLEELPARTHELPAKRCVIRVAGPRAVAQATVAWLAAHGRRGVVAEEYHYAENLAGTEVGRLWSPNAFLAEVLPQLPAGRALDVACGSGRDAVFIASCGWEVVGVDVLPDALERARDLGRRCAAAIRPIRWIEADVETEALDFGGRFDLITIIRYLHRPLMRRLAEWLKPGGSLVVETFTTRQREVHGKPAQDEFLLKEGELPSLLSGLEVRHYSEGWREDDHTARAWAVRA